MSGRRQQMTALLTAAAFLTLTPLAGAAVERTWTGSVNTDWFDGDNWTGDDDLYPQPGDSVIIPSGKTVLLTNETAELAAFSITNATLTFSNWTTRLRAEIVTIENGGKFTLPAAFGNAPAMSNRVWVACSNLFLRGGGQIDVSERGYGVTANSTGYGPGGGTGNSAGNGAGGGGYGGRGGRGQSHVAGGGTYPDEAAPTTPGSGGGSYASTQRGGPGGGAVRIEATGDVIIDGSVNANGSNNAGARSGGGSGGAIFIECVTFGGSGGVLSADGGQGDLVSKPSGGGGGGRIAVHYAALDGTPAVIISANRGIGAYGDDENERYPDLAAQVGTLYFSDNRLPDALVTAGAGTLEGVHGYLGFASGNAWTSSVQVVTNSTLGVPVSNVWRFASDVTVSAARVEIRAHATLEGAGNLTLTNASRLALHSGNTNGAADAYGALLDIANTVRVAEHCWIIPNAAANGGAPLLRVGAMTLDAGGGIDADRRGYGVPSVGTGYGPGGGTGHANGCGGGGYGGKGGEGKDGKAGGSPYPNENAPLRPGSGGGSYASTVRGGYGGGAVRIEASGAVTVDGTITANGEHSWVDTSRSGGGSGGAIYIVCASFAGGGDAVLSAIGGGGGLSSTHGGGGGGGGRIAVAIGFSAGDLSDLIEGIEIPGMVAYDQEPLFVGDITVAPGVGIHSEPPLAAATGTRRFLRILDENQWNVTIDGDPGQYGVPQPNGYGVWIFTEGTVLTNSVDSPASVTSTQRWICQGWELYDDQDDQLIAQDISTQAVFSVDTNLHLYWRWTNEYYLQVSAVSSGTVTGSGWVTNGLTATISANADEGYYFLEWDGDIPDEQKQEATTVLTMDRPRTVIATFASLVGVQKTWNGATADFASAENWIPPGIPAPKDSVVIPSGAVILSAPQIVDSLTISNATLIFTNWTTLLRAESVTIEDGGKFTLPAAFGNAGPSNRVWIACSNLFLRGGGQIDVSARGYGSPASQADGFGPAGGKQGSDNGAGGGGYGGRGGRGQSYAAGGGTYPDEAAPTTPGSGGGSYASSQRGGFGGGAVRIEADGAVMVDGAIAANGGDGGGRSGGGSGGAIFIECATFGGSGGVLSADGGLGALGSPSGGGGGGGRIAVHYAALDGTPAVTISANRGIGAYGDDENVRYPDLAAQVGTIYFSDNRLPDALVTSGAGTLEGVHGYLGFASGNAWTSAVQVVTNSTLGVPVSNVWRFASNATVSDGRVEIGAHATLEGAGNLTLTNASRLALHSGNTNALQTVGALLDVAYTVRIATNCWIIPNASTNGGAALLRVGDLRIDAGGGIDADRRGYGVTANSTGYGPGGGTGNSAGNGAGGGGYGGKGGNGATGTAGGNPYPDENVPLRPGSGGGSYASTVRGGYGGGAVRIEASGAVTVDGTITANGEHSWNWETSRSGGGSGGAIYIVCASFAGGGDAVLSADGGNGCIHETVGGGGGGGGRIAVWAGVSQALRDLYLGGDTDKLVREETAKLYTGDFTAAAGQGINEGQIGSAFFFMPKQASGSVLMFR